MKTLLILLSFIFLLSCNGQNSKTSLDAKTFSEKLHSENNSVLLDVRTADEYAAGHINGAVNINYNSEEFAKKTQKLDKNEPVYVYCLSGGRSADAAADMRKAGFKNVTELKGGILKWKKEGLEVTAPEIGSTKNAISLEQFNTMVNDTIPVLVDFYAPWCAPCRKMMPVVNELEKEYAGKVKVLLINIDENMELAGKLNVSEIPTLLVYKNNKQQARRNTLVSKEELLKLLF